MAPLVLSFFLAGDTMMSRSIEDGSFTAIFSSRITFLKFDLCPNFPFAFTTAYSDATHAKKSLKYKK